MNAAPAAIDPALLECEVGSFAIDSRQIRPGDVFLALSQPEYRENGFNGEFADSTPYVVSAFENGAAACVVRYDRYEEHRDHLEEFSGRLIFVEDVIAALQALAHGVYLDWGRPVIAVTGSAGKTTAKELIAHVLSSSGKKVLKNIKNYNNGLGHPLTVLNLVSDKDYDVAVLEMGMSTPLHEIARLCRITPPDIAVVLNVLPVHLEHLGSIENIARAKSEIVEGMRSTGLAVLNSDDERVAAMAKIAPGRTCTYGIENTADVRAFDIEFPDLGRTTFLLRTPDGEAKVAFPLNGRHNISNALAAAAVGYLSGISVGQIAQALSSVAAPPQRGEVLRFSDGFTVINDSYNSNPDALLSMISTVIDAGASKRKIVVAGEMLELGPDAEEIHFNTGQKIAGSGIDILIGVRGNGRELVDGAKDAGLEEVYYAEDSESAGDLICSMVRAGDVILIKGSRGVKTENVLEKLLEKFKLQEAKATCGAGDAALA